MSATPPESSKTPAPVDSKKQAVEKVKSVNTQLTSFEGKSGYNPFIWKRDNKWSELEAGVEKGDEKCIQKVLALPATIVPKVVSQVPLYEDIVPAGEKANNILQPVVPVGPLAPPAGN